MLSTVLSRRAMRCESAVIVFFGLCECLMTGLRRFTSRFLPIVAAALLSVVSTLRAENCCDPKGPFTLGEEYPEEPATCETIKYWADRAPRTEDRISLGIECLSSDVRAAGRPGDVCHLQHEWSRGRRRGAVWRWLSPRRRKTNHARSMPRIALADNWPPVGWLGHTLLSCGFTA